MMSSMDKQLGFQVGFFQFLLQFFDSLFWCLGALFGFHHFSLEIASTQFMPIHLTVLA